MSFFQRAKPRNGLKRKFDPKVKKAKIPKKVDDDEANSDSLDSELDTRDVPDRSESEGETETAQEKKLRLARQYLEEIEREERSRAENDTGDAVAARLRDDYLDQQGRLRREVADGCIAPSASQIISLRCKDVRLSITCLCISSDGSFLYSGSKCSALVKWSLADMKRVKSIIHKKGPKLSKKFEFHSSPIAAVAISTDSKYLVSCDQSSEIQVWNPDKMEHVHTFKGHRDHVTDVVFRKDTHQLFSASKDRSVKVWSLDEMAYVETVFGHQAAITSIDALSRERAITAGGRDNTIRIWKIVEESQLIFNGHSGSIDCVKLINEENFISCGDDGAICIWGNMKKKALCAINQAHGLDKDLPRWITSVAAMLNTDLVASGSNDGFVRLWKLNNGCKSIKPIMEIPLKGFINSLVFTPDGSTLIAGVGQEHKLARWSTIKEAKNAIHIIPILKNR